LQRNRLGSRDAVVRITVTRGAGGDGLVPPRRIRPTVLVIARSLPRAVSKWQHAGVPVVLLPFHPGLGGLLGGIKTTDYLTALVGKSLAREHGAFEGIYQTPSGEVLEGTTSNVFLVSGRRVETPPVSRGILPGITRERVLSLARRNGFTVRERTIRASELRRAEAAFLTASTIEVMPIRSVDGRPLRGDRSVVEALHEIFCLARDAEVCHEAQKSTYKN
jgi:branched-chain amino acid aminotransferase